VPNSDVDLLARKIGELHRCQHAYLKVGISLGEAAETRNQPARDKRRPSANGQYRGRFAPLQIGRGVGELVEQNPDVVEITAARLRHHDSARQPPEQRDPEPILEYLHQPTNRVGRNIEFGAGGLKSPFACGRLKCTDGVQRRQSTLITEPQFCGAIAPAIWTCLPQTFPDISKEQDRRPVGRATWPGKSKANGSSVARHRARAGNV
jgi:hypothetical protein